MQPKDRFLAIGLAIAILAALAPGSSLARAVEAGATGADGTETQVLRVEFWHLWQASGADLYQELCASCHGVDGAGDGPAAGALKVPAPALTDLTRDGVPRQHWTYALGAACDDRRNWTGTVSTKPCPVGEGSSGKRSAMTPLRSW